MSTDAAGQLPQTPTTLGRFLSALGPGIITGAADDDPSGVATYSIAGAQTGTTMLWTALLTWPLMAAVQMMCARIGMVTGAGLAASLRTKWPRPLLIGACIALLAANTINVGADLAGMADAAEMLSGISSHLWVLLFAAGISWATIRLRYYQIARVLKWLALALFAYVITAIHIGPDWAQVLRSAVVPSLPEGKQAWATMVAILGTTISPYLFFWQSSLEVEEEKLSGRKTRRQRVGATRDELKLRGWDVGLGTFFSNVVMFFIILTTALTLNRHGIASIESSRQAAEALRPLAGNVAYTLYTAGILGVGFLAIPTLTGSAAYAFAETFGWRQGLDQKLYKAKSFYGVIIASTAAALAFDLARLNPIELLYWTAVINGLLAPFLLLAILTVASDEKLMRHQGSSMLGRVAVGIATALMFIAGAAMFLL